MARPGFSAAAEGDASVVVTARATSPTVISDRRSNDCRADARITSVTIDAYGKPVRHERVYSGPA